MHTKNCAQVPHSKSQKVGISSMMHLVKLIELQMVAQNPLVFKEQVIIVTNVNSSQFVPQP